jgi:iron complex transport system substrate-binding protein
MTPFSTRLPGIAAFLALLALPAGAAEPQRIVSIGGAVTEIIYALGEGARIAAVDTTSLYPPEAKAHPNVGYMRQLSAEGVLSLSPDMILIEQGAGPAAAVARINQAGVPAVSVPAGHDAEALAEKVRTVAAAVGRGPEGEKLATTITADLATLRTDLGKVEKRQRVLFILSMADGRPMAAGTGTAADSIIKLAGAENVLADMKGYKGLSWEAAAALQPDVVLMMDRGGESHSAAGAFALPALAETPAGRNKALIKMDALYLLGFGPRTPAAARELASKLYPTLALAKP